MLVFQIKISDFKSSVPLFARSLRYEPLTWNAKRTHLKREVNRIRSKVTMVRGKGSYYLNSTISIFLLNQEELLVAAGINPKRTSS